MAVDDPLFGFFDVKIVSPPFPLPRCRLPHCFSFLLIAPSIDLAFGFGVDRVSKSGVWILQCF